MKTQLLEDIGENAPMSLTPPVKAGQPITGSTTQNLPPERSAPAVADTPQPAQAAAPDLDSVFEEIAALEAQYVAPVPNPEPVLEPTEPARPAPNDALPHKPAMAPAGSAPAPDPAHGHGATVPRDPVFDFTLPLPEPQAAGPQAAAPFTPAPNWTAPPRPRRRPLLWVAGLLTAALLVGGGWWLYEEHKLAGSLALVADGAKETLAVPEAVEEPTVGANRTDAAPPAAPMSSPAAAVPPLVMLEPEAPVAAKAEPSPPAPAEQEQPETASGSEADAARSAAFPLPKSLSQAASGEPTATAKTAPRKAKPEPVRQLARASAVQAERPAKGEGAMTALLRACREHGYHAAQCVKQGCSLTQYGFACRGR